MIMQDIYDRNIGVNDILIKNYSVRLIRLVFGLFLCSLGTILTIQANIGLPPWDVFHMGVSVITGISYGTINVLTGAVLIIVAMLLKEHIGAGSVINMFFIGIMADIIQSLKVIPKLDNFALGIGMLFWGQIFISLGTYFYLSASLGSGPRDSLMIALAKHFKKIPLGVMRGTIETIALLIGWLLGGKVGLGTVISAFGISFILQYTFKLLRFEVRNVHHESIFETRRIFIKFTGSKKKCNQMHI